MLQTLKTIPKLHIYYVYVYFTDAESETKKTEWREIAKKELEDWYKHREEQLEKTFKLNRWEPSYFHVKKKLYCPHLLRARSHSASALILRCC